MGKIILKIVGGEVTEIIPPCDSIIDLTLASPSPVPCCFVVNSGSKILFKKIYKRILKFMIKKQNKLNDFNQNYVLILNTDIKVMVLDKEFYSVSEITMIEGFSLQNF